MSKKHTLHLTMTKLVDTLMIGNYKTAMKWVGLEFSNFRTYNEQDDAKYIDFAASQREGKMLVRQFDEMRETGVFFMIDMTKSMYFGYSHTQKIHTLHNVLSLLIASAQKSNDRIGALVFDEEWYSFLKFSKWRLHIQQLYNIVMGKTRKKVPDFSPEKALKIFNNLPIKNTLVLILSDKMLEFGEKYLKVAAIKNDLVVINIFDFFENNLTSEKWVVRLKNTLWTWFLQNNEKKRQEYIVLRQQKLKHLAKKARSLRIRYIWLDNTHPIFVKLGKFFSHV